MGQKVNPIGLRLGIHRKWNSNWSFDFTNYSKFLYMNFDIEKFFKGFFYYYPIKTLLVNCQIVKLPSNQLYIFVLFYRLRKKKKKSIKKNFFKPLSYSIEKNSLIENNNNNISKNFLNTYYNLSYLSINKINKNKDKLNEKNIKDLIVKTNNNLIHSINLLKKNIKNISIIKNVIKETVFNKYLINYKKKLNIIKLLNTKLNILVNILILLNKKKNIQNNFEYKKINFKLNLCYKKYETLENQLKKEKILYNLNYILNLEKNKLSNKNKALSILILYNLLIDLNNLENKKITLQKHLFSKKYKNDRKSFNLIKNKQKKKYIFFNKNNNFKLKDIKKFLSKLTNLKTSIFFINSLSFIKFYYYLKQTNTKVKKDPNILLSIQQQMLNTYRYNAIYIQDFVNIAFVSIILKNPKFLTQFIAFQFKKLPKNKRQLKLIQLITKTIQIIGKERKEILGLKIQFKGRINKRKRARSIHFKDGIITLQSHSSRVEYGYTNAYTKSGSLGVKLWIFYKKSFKNELKQNFLQYIKYSNLKNNK